MVLVRVFSLPVTVCYRGVIGRAENKTLVEYAGAGLVPFRRLDIGQFDTVALVDAQPGTGNHPFREAEKVRIVLDHHPLKPETRRVPFFDVREHLGATTTLLYLYVRASGVEITRRTATAMLYALRSETADLGREASAVDLRLFKELYALADLRALSKIVGAKVGKGYFEVIHRSIDNAEVYGPLIVARVGHLPYPDAAAEIAEYFLKYQEVTNAFAIGEYGGEIFMSMRSDDPGARLEETARRIIDGFGTAGGHGCSAGGQIPVCDEDRDCVADIEKAVIDRLLKEFGLENERSRKLVSHI
jgi:nanoRNase/pAp phosphatase (c-di-AMP/oligoRNAs hydrolase)